MLEYQKSTFSFQMLYKTNFTYKLIKNEAALSFFPKWYHLKTNWYGKKSRRKTGVDWLLKSEFHHAYVADVPRE